MTSFLPSFLTFHRDAARHRVYAEKLDQGPLFDALSRTWVVTRPDHCRELMTSDCLHPDSYFDNYRALEERLGIDFSSITFALERIPLGFHGERHATLRRALSEFLALRREAVSACVPVAVARHFAALENEGMLEMMQDVIAPFVRDIMSAIVDVDIGPAKECENISLVFDKSLGVTRRRRIAEEVSSMHARFAALLGHEASQEDIGVRLAFVMVGRDSLLGTLGESLYDVFRCNAGSRLCDMDFPDLPPQTGVPVIERLVAVPFTLGGCNFAPGDRVRIMLQAFAYMQDARAPMTFFGAGAHACLGRPLSIECWKAIVACLSALPLRAQIVSYETRDTDYVFTCPRALQIRLSR